MIKSEILNVNPRWANISIISMSKMVYLKSTKKEIIFIHNSYQENYLDVYYFYSIDGALDALIRRNVLWQLQPENIIDLAFECCHEYNPSLDSLLSIINPENFDFLQINGRKLINNDIEEFIFMTGDQAKLFLFKIQERAYKVLRDVIII